MDPHVDEAGGPVFTVTRGTPTADELAALCAVLLSRFGRPGAELPAEPRRPMWTSPRWKAPRAWSPTSQAWRG